jgi:hypothetical protein
MTGPRGHSGAGRIDQGPRSYVNIPEFRDVEQRPDGSWWARHDSGREVTAVSYRHLAYVVAPAVRIAEGWRHAS